MVLSSFFFNDTATTEIYSLSLHDALPISSQISFTPAAKTCGLLSLSRLNFLMRCFVSEPREPSARIDRKSTRLNSSHLVISYAVFCLKKKRTRTRCYHTGRRTAWACRFHA